MESNNRRHNATAIGSIGTQLLSSETSKVDSRYKILASDKCPGGPSCPIVLRAPDGDLLIVGKVVTQELIAQTGAGVSQEETMIRIPADHAVAKYISRT